MDPTTRAQVAIAIAAGLTVDIRGAVPVVVHPHRSGLWAEPLPDWIARTS